MAAFVIADVQVTDPQAFAAYGREVPATVEKYGGEFVIRGGKVEYLEGEWQPQRLVAIRFEDAEQARQWYNSPEYQKIIGIRQANSIGSLILVEDFIKQ